MTHNQRSRAEGAKLVRHIERLRSKTVTDVTTILAAYTGRKITPGQVEIAHDQQNQWAVRVTVSNRSPLEFLVNLRQWSQGIDLDAVCMQDVEEVEFTSWPPSRSGR